MDAKIVAVDPVSGKITVDVPNFGLVDGAVTIGAPMEKRHIIVEAVDSNTGKTQQVALDLAKNDDSNADQIFKSLMEARKTTASMEFVEFAAKSIITTSTGEISIEEKQYRIRSDM